MRSCALLVSLLLLLAVYQTPAQWMRTAGPEGGRAEQLLTTGTSVLLTIEGGALYRSTDHGTTWVLSADVLGTVSDGCPGLVLTNGSVFAAQYNSGVFRSTNDGVTWNPSNGGMTIPGMFFTAIAASGDTLVITTNLGNHRSTDRGNQWVKTNAGMPPDTMFNALCAIGSRFLAGSDNGAGVFASTDGGASWARSSQGLTGQGLNVLCLVPAGGAVIAGTRQGAYRSTDSGSHWVLCSSGLTNKTVSALYAGGGDLYAGTYGFGLFRSTNLGVDWVQTAATPQNGNIRAITVVGSDLLVGTYGPDVAYRSSNAGGAWTAIGHGITNEGIAVMTMQGGRLLAGGFDAFMFTTNRGATWGAADTSIPKTAVYSLLTKGADVYVGSSGQGVFRSTDGGVKWFAASSGLNGNARTIWSMATDGSSLFAGTSSGVYRSSNDGGSWTQASQGIPDSVIRQVGAAPGAAYAAVPNLVYRTTDAGLHWTPASSGMPQYFQCNAFVTEDSDMFVGIVGGLYRTTNKGGSWTNVTAGFSSSPDVRALAVYPTGSKVLLAGLARGGVYLSTDRGVTWTFGGTGLASGITVTALSWEQGYLYAGTYSHGVWKRATSEMIVAVGKESAAPGQFELKQNYPNPFNGEATIQYTVGGVGLQASGVSNVQLQVFDLLGREIATLVNERKVPGTYSVSFDAGRLSSGVYLYRFTAGGYVQTRRMVVVK